MRRLGLVMKMGPISAVQNESPAAEAGIRRGDKIVKLDGEPVGDPVTLPARLRQLAGKTIRLTIERNGEQTEIEVPSRSADWFEQSFAPNSPVSIPVLGIAYPVLNRVEEVEDSPAAKSGLRAGDVIVKATVLPPPEETVNKYKLRQRKVSLELNEEHRNWPTLIQLLQDCFPGTTVTLELAGGKEVTLEPYESQHWFNPDRGLHFQADEFTQIASSWGEALWLGAQETVESVTMVLQFLRKIGTQISPKAFGGPGTIAVVAGRAAQQGLAQLLIFLTILSANLAVVNFLPIPLLDGGHMVFLAYEGIRGKPADERVQVVLTYLGLLFILGLMIWVIGLDIMRFALS
jgi:regulator of sigma E protease